MKFIEILKLKNKLFFLFFLITLGLISIGAMGTTYVNAMKKNIDALYFGSLIPVTELTDILHDYSNTLALTLYKASRGTISESEVYENMQNALDDIDKKWKSYKSHYKGEDELEYLEYADMELVATQHYFKKIMKLARDDSALRRLSMITLEKNLTTIEQVIQRLLTYEVDVAHYERQKFLYTYKNILKQIGFILTFVIVGVLTILLYVLSGIEKKQLHLELLTKKLKLANKKLAKVSYTDTLTNLHNRRYFNLIYERELKRAKRSKTYISFMMVDIDFFKQYNDTYGHLEGDEALKKVAKVLQANFKRPSDYIFRLGGEEFGVLLSETDESNTARLARALCDNIKGAHIKHQKSSICEYLTLSIGIACCVADRSLDNELLLSKADEMLYKAKETGRDKYSITTDISVTTPLKFPSIVEEKTA